MLIARRNGLMAGGGLSAKDYVQDGLVAMWDGIENAGWGQHDPSGLVELVSGTAATLNNITIGSNYLGFNGTNSHILVNGYNYLRIECVFSATNDNCAIAAISGKGIAISLNTYFITKFGATSKKWQWSHTPVQAGIMSAYTDIDSYFMQGRQGLPAPNSETWGASEASAIGCRWRNGGVTLPFAGRIHSLRLYSTSSQDDAIANYAVDKARFNLPDAT